MELDLTRVSKSEGFRETFDLEESLTDNTIEFCGERLKFASPVRIKGSAVNYEGRIDVEMKIKALVERTCSRCLESFIEEVETDCGYAFVREAKDDKQDYYIYKNDKVDITDLVLGEIAAKLTMKPLCNINCKGICPICGNNKNIIDCQCKNDEVDPRLQQLSKLLDR